MDGGNRQSRQENNLMAAVDQNALIIGDSFLLQSYNLELRDQQHGKNYLNIGNNSIIGGQFIFETRDGNVVVGDRVFMGSALIICKTSITIADDVIIESGVCLYDHTSHSLDYREREKDIRSVVEDHRAGRRFVQSKDWSVVGAKAIQIHRSAWIGRNATILKGVTVGQGAVVAPHSLVIRNVPPWTMVAGSPAEQTRTLPSSM